MSDAVDKIRHRLLHVSACLKKANLPYAVIGGNAVAAWVSRVDESAVRNTRDVDVLLRREDMPAAIAALSAAGYVHRRVASLGGGAMDVFLDGPEGKIRDAVHILFACEKPKQDSDYPNADVNESEDAGEFTLISLHALVRMKLAAWRDKDRVHLRDLADVGLVDREMIDTLDKQLADRLLLILDHPE
jgi:predicted nucleotidyltransferase